MTDATTDIDYRAKWEQAKEDRGAWIRLAKDAESERDAALKRVWELESQLQTVSFLVGKAESPSETPKAVSELVNLLQDTETTLTELREVLAPFDTNLSSLVTVARRAVAAGTIELNTWRDAATKAEGELLDAKKYCGDISEKLGAAERRATVLERESNNLHAMLDAEHDKLLAAEQRAEAAEREREREDRIVTSPFRSVATESARKFWESERMPKSAIELYHAAAIEQLDRDDS